jgi:hypothetical protein
MLPIAQLVELGDAGDEAHLEQPDAFDWARAELEEHVREEHSTFSWLLEPMIERSGFEIVRAERSDDGIFAKYVLRAG